MPVTEQVTLLLARWESGDKAAFDLLSPLIYDELRRLVAHRLRQILVDHALGGLAAFDGRRAQVIELRYLGGGMSIQETAQALNISVASVGRGQRFTEAWLRKNMTESASTNPTPIAKRSLPSR